MRRTSSPTPIATTTSGRPGRRRSGVGRAPGPAPRPLAACSRSRPDVAFQPVIEGRRPAPRRGPLSPPPEFPHSVVSPARHVRSAIDHSFHLGPALEARGRMEVSGWSSFSAPYPSRAPRGSRLSDPPARGAGWCESRHRDGPDRGFGDHASPRERGGPARPGWPRSRCHGSGNAPLRHHRLARWLPVHRGSPRAVQSHRPPHRLCTAPDRCRPQRGLVRAPLPRSGGGSGASSASEGSRRSDAAVHAGRSPELRLAGRRGGGAAGETGHLHGGRRTGVDAGGRRAVRDARRDGRFQSTAAPPGIRPGSTSTGCRSTIPPTRGGSSRR
jgi:hypothetical protein